MIKEEYVFMLYALFIDQVSRIINNTNILTDGRWRYYNEMSQRIGYAIDTANYKRVRKRF